MTYRRWYPTATTLPDGRIILTSGAQSCDTCLADVPEIYNPTTNKWTALNSARLGVPYYPLCTYCRTERSWTPAPTNSPSPRDTRPADRHMVRA